MKDMIAKYHIQYTIRFSRHPQLHHFQTDDPVTAQQFLADLLERNFHLTAIRHDGVDLESAQFDHMLKIAAEMVAGRHLEASLNLSAEEVHHRFGFNA